MNKLLPLCLWGLACAVSPVQASGDPLDVHLSTSWILQPEIFAGLSDEGPRYRPTYEIGVGAREADFESGKATFFQVSPSRSVLGLRLAPRFGFEPSWHGNTVALSAPLGFEGVLVRNSAIVPWMGFAGEVFALSVAVDVAPSFEFANETVSGLAFSVRPQVTMPMADDLSFLAAVDVTRASWIGRTPDDTWTFRLGARF